MEPRPFPSYTLGSTPVTSQESILEEIYNRIQIEHGVEGIVTLVRYVTKRAIEEREFTLKNLESEAIDLRRAIEMINQVAPPTDTKKSPY
jgi:hypothetical protein